jgi:riboflavin biosynthesis pyrimidine reductase
VDDRAKLARLLPAGDAVGAARYVEEMGLWERPEDPPRRPRVLLNMVAAVDGRATVDGHSAPLSSRADRELFHALRAPADAVLVGAGTVRTERYGPLIRDPDTRARRVERGLPAEPLACVVSASLRLDPEIPLLADPQTRLVVLTPSDGALEPAAARVEYVRRSRGRQLDLAGAIAELHERFGTTLILCEGGPHLAWELFAASLLDELFLALSPRLVGGVPHDTPLRIVAGPELEPPVELILLGALECESSVFLRYGVVAPDRVS